MKQLIFKTIYHPKINVALRIINKWLYPLLPEAVKLPPSGKMTINVDRKPLIFATNQTSYLTQLLFWNGYQNFEYTPIFLDLIKKLDSFFDVGANIGYYSLLAAHVNKQIKVVAFEPALGPLFYLKENIRLNQLNNIIVESDALSDKNGKITFYEVESEKYHYLKYNLAGEGNTGSKTTERNFVKNEVSTLTLETYIKQHQIDKIDLLKIDTEGTEHLILQHSGPLLSEMKPIIICETLFGMIEKELDQLLSQYGYEFYNHTPEGLKKVPSIIRVEDDGVTNCFFVHPDKKALIEPYLAQSKS